MKDDTVSRAAVIETIKSHFRVDNDLLEVIVYEVAHLPAVQTCEDVVSRQAAIDVLSLGKEILSRVLDDMDVVGTDREKYSWGLGLIESNIKDIEELPSAQPQPRTGKWIVHLYKLGEERYECDNCHGRCDREYKFCPNCGADMRGDNDEPL